MHADNWPIDTPVPTMLERVQARATQRRHRRRLRNALVGSVLTAVVAVASLALTSTPVTSSLRTTPAEEGRVEARGPGPSDPGTAAAARLGTGPGGGPLPPGGGGGLPTSVPPAPRVPGRPTTTTTAPRAPTPAGDREIAFVRNDNRIWLVRADGSDEAPLTAASHRMTDPDWAPDGTRLLVQSWYTDATGYAVSHVAVVGLDGTVQRLTPDGKYGAPKWSPDGSSIAFIRPASSALSTNDELWVMDADGSDERRITENLWGSMFSWSPDGSRLAYEAQGGLRIVRSDGTDDRLVPNTWGHRDPAWSPEGDRIAVNILDEHRWYLATIRPDGTGRRVLAEQWFTHRMDWSPDGRTLVFAGERVGDSSSDEPVQIRRIDADGSDHRQVTQGPSAFRPTWRPKPGR
jgi:TolB protein